MPDLFLDLGKYERGYHEQKKSEEIKKEGGFNWPASPNWKIARCSPGLAAAR